LGPNTSEEAARKARYSFLNRVQKKHRASGIITAHHQDDLIETILLNILRGTGIRGVVAISANQKILRPMLKFPKKTIAAYAQKNKIGWREDLTNTDNKYLRNYLRNVVLPGLTHAQREEILKNHDKIAELNISIDILIARLSQSTLKYNKIDRSTFALLPIEIGKELVAYWLRENRAKDFDKKTISRIDMAIRTFPAGTVCPVVGNLKITIDKKTAQFIASPVNR
jgi:tRNA(Ile)-lysidine synthase TilS/MesJ